MRRADRLFKIVQLLRRGEVMTAADLAHELDVSERTLYRDIRDLIASGMPIEGEAGVGYVMREGFELPPLMFTTDELEALMLGARMVEASGDDLHARRAQDVLAKVKDVLPEELQKRLETVPTFPSLATPERQHATLESLRRAIPGRRKIRLTYTSADGHRTERLVHPLGLLFGDPSWFLIAWCELSTDFRTFRPDRMGEVEVLEETFELEPGRDLETFLSRFTG